MPSNKCKFCRPKNLNSLQLLLFDCYYMTLTQFATNHVCYRSFLMHILFRMPLCLTHELLLLTSHLSLQSRAQLAQVQKQLLTVISMNWIVLMNTLCIIYSEWRARREQNISTTANQTGTRSHLRADTLEKTANLYW